MDANAAVLSKTLQSISLTKINEANKLRTRYDERKEAILQRGAQRGDDQHQRIAELLKGLKDVDPEALNSSHIANVKLWLEQGRYDSSVKTELLDASEALIRNKLEVQSNRLSLAHLYSSLVSEWMEPSAAMEPEGEESASDREDASSFEMVDRQKQRLQELCDQFAKVVFDPLETDALELDLYMNELFPSDDAQAALKSMRSNMTYEGERLFANATPFDPVSLKKCIRGLLVEDLLSDEKIAVLRSFLDNQIVLQEISDVLNMRFAEIDAWEWMAGPEGIPVLPRQQLNGKYRIWMDEDVLQAILIHYIGIKCCVSLKAELASLVNTDKNGVWQWGTAKRMPKSASLRWKYYTGEQPEHTATYNMMSVRKSKYQEHFFLSQLPESDDTLSAYLGGDDDKDDDQEGKKKDTVNIKQLLLRTLAGEVVVHRALHGEAAVVQSDLRWYATGLSHTTIFATMRFFGFSERIIEFFKKVLEAPLNLTPSTDVGEGDHDPAASGPRIRRRGVPLAHAVEKLMGELVLFVMDLVVNREAGMLLYRLHDDLYFVGKPAQCARAWEAIQKFAKILGVEFNTSKTGSVCLTDRGKEIADIAAKLPQGTVRIGHLVLDPSSGEWIIDQDQVGKHVAQLKKQLASSRSVLDWVQTWNSCIGRFFSHMFGDPAYCFGVKHVDSILETYRRMQTSLFGDANAENGNKTTGASAVQYLKNKIQQRFGATDVPEAFIFLPEKLGGLGLRNPFVALLARRSSLSEEFPSPDHIMKRIFEEEKKNYAALKKSFDEIDTLEGHLSHFRKANSYSFRTASGKQLWNSSKEDEKVLVSGNTPLLSETEQTKFFSFDEYMKYCEQTSAQLGEYYEHWLLAQPRVDNPVCDRDVSLALSMIDMYPNQVDPPTTTIEATWALQMFRQELIERFGGMRLVEAKYLPLGMLGMMRQKRVRWNMVL